MVVVFAAFALPIYRPQGPMPLGGAEADRAGRVVFAGTIVRLGSGAMPLLAIPHELVKPLEQRQ